MVCWDWLKPREKPGPWMRSNFDTYTQPALLNVITVLSCHKAASACQQTAQMLLSQKKSVEKDENGIWTDPPHYHFILEWDNVSQQVSDNTFLFVGAQNLNRSYQNLLRQNKEEQKTKSNF
ncbi:hypothetical protein EYF80_020894 [Liparis tanakae]|uniref:Uncharacterized protein n=1 Tax=Liparis tanakae TaxID=230148 RepID=A0A4Z2HST8_9TELE|nr:hypothetical protein EYF80_020894 [Liparis tanakae]